VKQIVIYVEDEDFAKICQNRNITEEVLKNSIRSAADDYIGDEVWMAENAYNASA
jgi:hypothetical protein